MSFRFSIDRGGTFTDIYCEYETPAEDVPGSGGKRIEEIVYKLLSVDPAYPDAPLEGIRRIMNKKLGGTVPRTQDIDVSRIEYVRMGTTVATNALLERKGEPCALLTTRGFGDLLKIGNQSRPDLFDLEIKKPSLLYQEVIEVDERVRLLKDDEAAAATNYGTDEADATEDTVDGEAAATSHRSYRVEVLQSLDLNAIKSQLQSIREKGISSLAVVLLHSYAFPDHEVQVGALARGCGFTNISLSHQVMPMIRAVPRGHTTCVDAYLTPIIHRYVDNFMSGFGDRKKAEASLNVTFMQSDGGLTPAKQFKGSHAIMSGPAGGVVGYSMTAFDGKRPVIGFDMGGTSTDVSRFNGEYEHVFETEEAGVVIQAPMLDIQTVAAGGGSRLFFRSGMFVVGPESASAHPGPVCYRKNGYLAITDANLFLGRLIPDYFPKIFGPSEDQPLDLAATTYAFEQLTAEINEFNVKNGQRTMTPQEVAYGFIKVANEAMARPIRNMTVAKGYDTRDHVLSCFGGAGAQHCCAIAKSLGIDTVKVHRYSGILSAYGLSMADVVKEVQEPCAKTFGSETVPFFTQRFTALAKDAVTKLRDALKVDNNSSAIARIEVIKYLNMRYVGTDYTLMISLPSDDEDYSRISEYNREFEARYKREYGFNISGRDIIVDDIRVRAVAHSAALARQIHGGNGNVSSSATAAAEPSSYGQTYFEELGLVKTPVFELGKMPRGCSVEGPAIIIQDTATIVVLPDCTARVTTEGDVEISIRYSQKSTKQITELDPVQLSIFNHRFMSIAEQMGRTLQRTAISTNIKERLDFSCALFSPDGGLVANAPAIPVHIGSMSEAVRYQIRTLGSSWKPGDVVVTNHPTTGGTHLPDITVITPVFDKTGTIVFFVASRGHHADIGGITPGSMPPFSRYLSEEGAAIKSFKLVSNGVFQEDAISEIMKESRSLRDCIADLKAQVAANQKGISLIYGLIEEYTLEVVHAYMRYVRENAELAVRDLLKKVIAQRQTSTGENVVLEAIDFMDDGTRLKLSVTLYSKEQDGNIAAEFDFTGTSEQVLGNTNAPRAITMSAILYCLRCMVNIHGLPLNEGCLRPIKIIIPERSILDPSDEIGVVAGNVLTSQRLVDVVFKAFGACAASQGCMNNTTFGSSVEGKKFGYYETICGGCGAGPHWNGASATHSHMTNTRITDPEILEKRYPVLLRQFSIRRGSGGKGKYYGGDGVVREFEALDQLSFGILSERRVYSPYGLNGGSDGAPGRNLLLRKKQDGLFTVYNLGGKNTVMLNAGDRVVLQTPGGGAWGKADA